MTEEKKSKNEISKVVGIGALSLGIVGLGLGFWIGKNYGVKKESAKWLKMFSDSVANDGVTVDWVDFSPTCAIKFLVKVVDVIDK